MIPSLFLGIVLGSWFTYGLSIPGIWFGLLDTIQIYVLEALVPPDGSKNHMQIVIFTLMMGGMIGIIYRNGGAHAIAERRAQETGAVLRQGAEAEESDDEEGASCR